MLELYRAALALRRAEPALGDGTLSWLPARRTACSRSPANPASPAWSTSAAQRCRCPRTTRCCSPAAHSTTTGCHRTPRSGCVPDRPDRRRRRPVRRRRRPRHPAARPGRHHAAHLGRRKERQRRTGDLATDEREYTPHGRAPHRAPPPQHRRGRPRRRRARRLDTRRRGANDRHPARAAGLSPFDITGRGATVPFREQEAEQAAHTGTKIGPDRRYGTLPSEASGREAVTLDAVGEYVEFTLTAPANAVTFRYSLPDNAAGTGRDATIDLRANGTLVKAVPVTSRYGWYYGGYPFNNNPGDTNPHHFYDETRTMFGTTYPAGTKIRLQVSSTAQSPTFTIDLADFELVGAPITKPSGVLDVVTDFGADPSGATDSTAKFQAAVDAGKAQGRAVWIPAGTFTLWDHVVVDGVTLRGAGPWYSVLGGRHPTDRKRAAGIYGKYVPGGGYWRDPPARGRRAQPQRHAAGLRHHRRHPGTGGRGPGERHRRRDDQLGGGQPVVAAHQGRRLDGRADGRLHHPQQPHPRPDRRRVNFHWGVTDSTVTNTFVRNTGDDALAMWAQSVPNVGNSFTRNTIGVTILANHLVTYGGRDITIAD
ncbi:glycosyl hydrolase family 28-related protein [Micromonospora sp. BRA006-A]|nr:glycosyl hydrolase family 28-related protein [Micromonospora sp. BRA006-A]